MSLESELVSAMDGHRLFRSRLSGGFPFAECRADETDSSLVTGLSCHLPADQEGAVRSRVSDLGNDVMRFHGENPGPDADRLLAIWAMMASDRLEDLQTAVTDLQRATRARSDSPDLWSDLAAVHLVVADIGDDPESIVEALDASDRALELQADHSAALFNRALALDHLHLRDAVLRAWDTYLAEPGQEAWRGEAEGFRSAAASPRFNWERDRPQLFAALQAGDAATASTLAQQYAAAAEVDAVQGLLPQWGVAYSEGRSEAADSLWALATEIERLIRPVMGESVLRSALEAIAADDDEGGRVGVHARAMAALEQDEPGARSEDAAAILKEAGARLRGIGNPLSLLADHYLAQNLFLALDDVGAQEATQRLLLDLPSLRWNHWAADGHRRLGAIAGTQTRWNDARAEAESILAQIHPTDRPLSSLAYSELAFAVVALEGVREAWPPAYRGLRILRQIDAPRATYSVASRAAELLAARGHTRASVTVQDEVVAAMRGSDSFVLKSGALRRRAELNFRAGRLAEAARDVESAFVLADSIRAGARRRIVRADLSLVEGEIWGKTDPALALTVLPSVIADFTAQEYSLKLPRAHLALATTRFSLGQDEEAERELIASIEGIEEQGAAVSRAERTRVRGTARPLFEQLVTLQALNNEVEQSFDFLERMRSKVLIDGIPEVMTPPSLQTLQAQLDSTTTLLSFGVFEERLFTWVLSQDTLTLVQQAVPATDIRAAVEDLRGAIRTGRDLEARSLSARLYDWLIAPIEANRPLRRTVVLVPDRSLHYVPFAALWDQRKMRYLIEDHVLVVAPSAVHFTRARDRHRRDNWDSNPTVLAVGNPSFPVGRYPRPDLPFAEQEARSVVSAWGSNGLLLGEHATRAAFMRLAPTATIIHFAGHAVLRPESPLDSYLLLAPSDAAGSDAELSSRDLLEMELPNTALVILSACATADGRLSETEGAISLARGFLGAGVSGVVSSLWAVADESTSQFFSEFHYRLANVATPPAEALRQTQLSFLSAESGTQSGIGTWAAFQMVGGG